MRENSHREAAVPSHSRVKSSAAMNDEYLNRLRDDLARSLASLQSGRIRVQNLDTGNGRPGADCTADLIGIQQRSLLKVEGIIAARKERDDRR
jgi:hypothetical protein